jgi:hypothetical protein
MDSARSRRGLIVILALYLALAGMYSVTTPVFEASDEVWHYPFVKRLADGEGLPTLSGDHGDPWRQEGGQPPLYYALGALLTRGIDTGDLHEVRWLNPHADTGVIKPDGNANMVVHTERERWPYRGTVLALRLVRWMSALMGAVTVWAAYRLGREFERRGRRSDRHARAPGIYVVGWGAAALTAFNAMFLFITSSVNNDALVNALCAVALWMIVHYVAIRPRPWQWALLGGVLGLATLSKLSGLAMLPVAAVALRIVTLRRHLGPDASGNWRNALGDLLVGGVMLGLPVVAISGWWFVRNWALYRDPTGLSAFLDVVGRRYPQPTLRQLAGEWRGFVMSFWGLFGTVNVPAPEWFYDLLNGFALVGLLGLPLYSWRIHGTRVRRLVQARSWDARRWIAGLDVQMWQLGLVLLWIVTLSVSFVRWTLMTPASQGRLLFPGLTGINLLLVLGLMGWTPGRFRAVLPAAMGMVMLATAAMLPFTAIAPTYARPEILEAVPEELTPMDVLFVSDVGQPQMRLLGYRIHRHGEPSHEDSVGRRSCVGPNARHAVTAGPGDALAVTLCWQAEQAMRVDYSVFVHLLAGEAESGDGQLVSQRDVYPGLGAFPTSLWQPGDRIADTYVLPIPPTTMTPNELYIAIGLYRLGSGERLAVAGSDGEAIDDHLRLGRIVLPTRIEDGIPNPVHITLDGGDGPSIALVGYDLNRAAAAPGETLHLTLYWRALRDGQANYSVFTQVVGSQDNIWAQMDGWPLGGKAPTAAWRKGQLIVDPYTLIIHKDAPPGVYDLQVGMYTTEGTRLTVLGAGGHAKDTRILLGSVRVLAAR